MMIRARDYDRHVFGKSKAMRTSSPDWRRQILTKRLVWPMMLVAVATTAQAEPSRPSRLFLAQSVGKTPTQKLSGQPAEVQYESDGIVSRPTGGGIKKPLSGWIDQALTSRSGKNRELGLRTLRDIVQRHNPQRDPPLDRSQIQQAARKALGDEERQSRLYALEILASLGDAAATEAVLPCLRDKEVLVRARAAQTVGKLKADSAVGSLAKVINDRQQAHVVREACAEALGQIGTESARKALADAAKRNSEPGLAREIANAMDRANEQSTPSQGVRYREDGGIEDADARNSQAKTVEQWISQASNAVDAYNKQRALGALRMIVVGHGIRREPTPKLAEIQRAARLALKDKNAKTKEAALGVFEYLKDKSDAPFLVESFGSSAATQDLANCVEAARQLGDLRASEAVQPLAKALGDRALDLVIRRAAARALGSIGGDAAKKALLNSRATKPDAELVREIDLALDVLEGKKT